MIRTRVARLRPRSRGEWAAAVCLGTYLVVVAWVCIEGFVIDANYDGSDGASFAAVGALVVTLPLGLLALTIPTPDYVPPAPDGPQIASWAAFYLGLLLAGVVQGTALYAGGLWVLRRRRGIGLVLVAFGAIPVAAFLWLLISGADRTLATLAMVAWVALISVLLVMAWRRPPADPPLVTSGDSPEGGR